MILGAATFGLSHLTRSVGTWILAVLLAFLWIAGITGLRNAIRGRSILKNAVIAGISTIGLFAHLDEVSKEEIREIVREVVADAVAEIKQAMRPQALWKRAFWPIVGLLAGSALSWLLGYKVPAPPPPPTTANTTPSTTTSPRPSAPPSTTVSCFVYCPPGSRS